MRRNVKNADPISFGRAYAQSETFRTLFQDGMSLVEETASYLDGPGRAAAKTLGRPGSIVYATESMRLTTRLMQLASWLLLHRSVNEGDISLAQAAEEKQKIKMEKPATSMNGPGWDQLPEEFKLLVGRSLTLQNRIERIDAAIMEESEPAQGPATNPVARQMEDLANAFGKVAS